MDLRDAKVLVTGASGGIGRALATELAANGGKVILTGRRIDVLKPLADKLHGRAIAADLTEPGAIDELMSAAGQIDVLVANAALPATGLLADYGIDELDRALDVNLRVPIVMAQRAAEHMSSRRRGHLVFISSLSGKTASSHASLYNATKFGIRGFALALRQELRSHNVGVSTVFPGFISDAGMFADSGATLPRGIGTRSPQDVARATVRAIAENAAEVDVAPLNLRLLAMISGAAPSLAAAVQHRAGASKVTEQLGEGQRHKR
ncbi:SDR family oxidoreductase [Mycolicibacterium sp. HK-90]|uniref:SDR family NAD(P)-dependent oxidoreductase n=1 Tax=Mycolicibacterium sp. HK-90 TaxID=3056937 RepID=UPI00265A798B|nr:SDR family NAD(P)-dependent oxidoreductase [Mycolicibacterium sp. HK-90]WKG04399.1 SDR family NAD(P)-dependent oxidoreductase [Mycolicibacterium sp. HK-90]